MWLACRYLTLSLFACLSLRALPCHGDELPAVHCEGLYSHHLQGVAADAEHLYWCFTTTLAKTDRQGKVVAKVPVADHHGDLCHVAGKIYVAVNLGQFNDPQGNADSWIYVYKASDLTLVAKHRAAEVTYGAGGIGYRGGHFFVVGGLPEGVEQNYVYEYDGELRFVRRHELASGHTHLGIQTATFAHGRWWFGCYGEPKTLLVADEHLRFQARYAYDVSLGIESWVGGKLLCASGERNELGQHSGSVRLAQPHAQQGLQAIDEPLPPRLGPGDHARTIRFGDQRREFLAHIPPQFDAQRATPVVLALHGAAMNGSMMARFSGLSAKADEAGFVVVYPSGSGVGPLRVWNAGGFSGRLAENRADDVGFIRQLLDELNLLLPVDSRRVYACGMSNGAMMCYRLAAELSDRIAAIGPVAGVVAIDESKPTRPVPVLHFHGSRDSIVPFDLTPQNAPPLMKLKSVSESIELWVRLNGCVAEPTIEELASGEDDLRVERRTYAARGDGAEVILVVIDQGGHTWPGQQPQFGFLGKSSRRVAANDLLWEFFQRHQLPAP